MSSKAPFTIRPAEPGDVTLIHRFILELAEYERMLDEAVLTVEDVHRALFGETPAAEVVLAYEGEEPAGLALFFHNFSTFLGRRGLYLEDLYVRPAFRGRGYGKALLVHLAGIARDRGCGRMDWEVLAWNEGPIRFYESLGAVAMNEWRHFRLTGEALQRVAEQGSVAAGKED
ncbi:MAG: GNAT family N-acetyltransferase [Acidobacteriota bacterium]|nr:GNAT family N-acetyltransferase [Acidobacteriota bacterium]